MTAGAAATTAGVCTTGTGAVRSEAESAGAAKDEAEGTDFFATAQGHVSITPLQVDLTDPRIKEADVWVLVHREVNARQWYTGNALQDKAQFLGHFALLGGK